MHADNIIIFNSHSFPVILSQLFLSYQVHVYSHSLWKWDKTARISPAGKSILWKARVAVQYVYHSGIWCGRDLAKQLVLLCWPLPWRRWQSSPLTSCTKGAGSSISKRLVQHSPPNTPSWSQNDMSTGGYRVVPSSTEQLTLYSPQWTHTYGV